MNVHEVKQQQRQKVLFIVGHIAENFCQHEF